MQLDGTSRRSYAAAMIWITRIMAFLLGFAAVLVIVYAVALNFGFDRVWERLAGSPDMGNVNFANLAKGPKPNQALVCPAGLCDETSVDFASPVYAVPVDKLRQALLAGLEIEPRLERVDKDEDVGRLRFVQRTANLRFPDTVSVELIALSPDTSTLALYSRSQIGTSDFGVNRARVERWLDRLRPLEMQR